MPTPAYLIDIFFLLLAPQHPVLVVLALMQFGVRRSGFFCRGFATMKYVKALPEWARLTLLPGLVESVPVVGDEAPAVVSLATTPAQPLPTGALTTEQWRDALNDSPHLLLYGPSKAGKSTLAQAIVAMFGDCDYVVIDPMPNKPGEQKWGGINFVTLDDTGDEYAGIKAMLSAIDAEDQRRRHALRIATPRPLVVIIDEVLALVGELGFVANEDGKKEARISQFIRTKGYSARHRNIKIILIGQGKNLHDLGLNSSTARNNYALVRCSRNPATNERRAAIVTDDGEQLIDLQYVPELATRVRNRARQWQPNVDRALERLLAPIGDAGWGDVVGVSCASPGSVGSGPAEPGSVGFGLPNAGSGVGSVQFNSVNRAETILPGNRTELASLMKALTLYQQTGKETEAIEQAFGVQKGSGKEYVRARALFKTALQEAQH